MDIKLILFSGYEILLSIIFGLASIFIFLKVFDLVFFRKKGNKSQPGEPKETNIASGILKGTIIVCLLLLIQSSIIPSVNTLRVMVLNMEEIKIDYILISFGYFFLFYVIAIIISILLILITIKIYTLATIKVDEIMEIKQNNIAISIILSFVIAGMVLFMRPAVQHFLSSLINYDAIEKVISPEEVINPEDGGLRIYSDTEDEDILSPNIKIDEK